MSEKKSNQENKIIESLEKQIEVLEQMKNWNLGGVSLQKILENIEKTKSSIRNEKIAYVPKRFYRLNQFGWLIKPDTIWPEQRIKLQPYYRQFEAMKQALEDNVPLLMNVFQEKKFGMSLPDIQLALFENYNMAISKKDLEKNLNNLGNCNFILNKCLRKKYIYPQEDPVLETIDLVSLHYLELIGWRSEKNEWQNGRSETAGKIIEKVLENYGEVNLKGHIIPWPDYVVSATETLTYFCSLNFHHEKITVKVLPQTKNPEIYTEKQKLSVEDVLQIIREDGEKKIEDFKEFVKSYSRIAPLFEEMVKKWWISLNQVRY